LREEGHVESKVEEGGGGGGFSTIDVDGIGESLEGVEGDPYRQDDGESWRLENDPKHLQQQLQVLEEKSAVLEAGKESQIGSKTQSEKGTPKGHRTSAGDPSGYVPVNDGRKPEKKNKGRIPRCVEEVTGDEQMEFATPPVPETPIYDEHDRKEDQEGKRIEDQGSCLSREEVPHLSPKVVQSPSVSPYWGRLFVSGDEIVIGEHVTR
jgi:hypothetical protein